ncbi:MAG TPA: efflux transporter outer membrane subunit [Candidatus Acidoferrales bacterium]|nr:efflux transporter outer membrane subunit [Candidatus Acidoferrales bacterium]
MTSGRRQNNYGVGFLNRDETSSSIRWARQLLACVLSAALLLSGCTVGPKYHRPSVTTPEAFKELTPADYPSTDGWKVAQPRDAALKGKWWEIFNDPQLNALEEQVNVSNQTIASAAAAFLVARAMVRQARSQYFPTVTVGPSINASMQSGTLSSGFATGSGTGTGTGVVVSPQVITNYSLPFDATWVPDLFGRVRNNVRANANAAQASAADLENTRLTVQAEVAVDYFSIRGQDALKQLLDDTVVSFQESLRLTQALYETGIDSDEAVAQAETQLESAQAQDTNLGILRSQFEHAVATLVGQPAPSFSIPTAPLRPDPPAIPYAVPSQLLERRPDIAASERLMAQANAQIGVAVAAYYPTVTLSASGGFETSSFTSWFTWPSRFWSAGPSASETIFDGGLRRATVQQFEANFLENVANYRQTVLAAFQNVEDNLASLRILSVEIRQQDTAVGSAQRNLKIAIDRYRLGIDPYLNVITAETALFTNQQTAVNLRIQQMTASVQLVEAVGGGWDASQLPSAGMMSAPLTVPKPDAKPPSNQ